MGAVRFSVVLDPVGAHVHVRIWANGALTGVLIMRPDEAAELACALVAPEDAPGEESAGAEPIRIVAEVAPAWAGRLAKEWAAADELPRRVAGERW